MTAQRHLQALSRQECLRLLASVPVGRVVFTERALPAIRPVNFILDGEQVIIRTAADSGMQAAVRNAVVAFEADEIDTQDRIGWSVVLTGRARLVTDPEEIRRLEALPLTPWADGQRSLFLAIPAELLSGRVLRADQDAKPATIAAKAG